MAVLPPRICLSDSWHTEETIATMAAKTDQDRVQLQRQIDGTDCEIDRLVYDLYCLTDEEIRIVEGG